MALFLLKRPQIFGSTVADGRTAAIVEADSEAAAKRIATAQDAGDSPWATATQITANVAADYEGFTYRVKVSGDPLVAGSADVVDVTYTAVASDTVDSIGAALANLMRGSAVEAAIADDGGAYTDETTEANEDTANDMTLFPSTPAADDAYLIGMTEQFSRVLFNVGTNGAGTYTVAWEYWNGSGWSALSGVTDDTGDFKNVGLNDLVFTIPSNWATTTINSQGPFYYIRAKIDGGTTTTVPLGTRAYAGTGLRASYYSPNNVLTVAAGGDAIGDHTLVVEAKLPSADAPLSDLVGTITDQGLEGDALSVILEDETAIPAILAQL
jgi:hypothetical protein